MLCFEMTAHGSIQMFCDEEGRKILIEALMRIETRGHTHLRTPSCGGTELDEKNPWDDENVIPEVIMTWC